MTDQPKRKIIQTLETGGWITHIPTSDDPDSPKVKVWSKTWRRLSELGVCPLLNIDNAGYVMSYCPKYRTYKRLARLIKNCNDTEKCHTIDGNELNLLDENLVVTPPEPPIYDRSFLSPESIPYFAQLVEYETIWPEPDLRQPSKIPSHSMKVNIQE